MKKTLHQKRLIGMATSILVFMSSFNNAMVDFAVHTIDKKTLWLYGIEKGDDPKLCVWDLVKMRLVYKTRLAVPGNLSP